jgi:hypothetical protein
MNCERWEKMAALAVEGDLPDDELPELERHLAGCPDCRDFANELYDTQAALHDLGQETIGPEAYREVREAVLRRIGDRQSDWRMWYAIAAALVLAAVLGGLEWTRHRPVERPANVAVKPQSQREATPIAPTAVVHRAAHRRRRGAGPVIRAAAPPQRQQNEEPLLVKLVSDDPDVIIYWLVDRNGE